MVYTFSKTTFLIMLMDFQTLRVVLFNAHKDNVSPQIVMLFDVNFTAGYISIYVKNTELRESNAYNISLDFLDFKNTPSGIEYTNILFSRSNSIRNQY